MNQKRTWPYCRMAHNGPDLPDFHVAAEDGDVDILLILKLSRLGRDADRVAEYWRLLRDLGV